MRCTTYDNVYSRTRWKIALIALPLQALELYTPFCVLRAWSRILSSHVTQHPTQPLYSAASAAFLARPLNLGTFASFFGFWLNLIALALATASYLKSALYPLFAVPETMLLYTFGPEVLAPKVVTCWLEAGLLILEADLVVKITPFGTSDLGEGRWIEIAYWWVGGLVVLLERYRYGGEGVGGCWTYGRIDETFLLAAVLVQEIVGVARELVAACFTGFVQLSAAAIWTVISMEWVMR